MSATSADHVRKAPARRAFIRVRLEQKGNRWTATLAGGQDSHVLSALAAADGLAIIPEERDEVSPGEELFVIRIR